LHPERIAVERFDEVAERRNDLPGETFRLLTKDVAYLKLSSASSRNSEEYIYKASGTKVLVIDIRNYPKDFMVFALGGHFVDRPTAFARFTTADAANPGAFVWTSPIALQPVSPTYAGRIVILVDESSQSQAEYTAMAFRSARGALVAGSTTAGADGNVSPIVLPGGLRTLISGIGVFYPDRRPTQQVGIVPDIVVHPTISGIRQGRDEVLEAAVSRALGKQFRLRGGGNSN
jgi:C-terminal processing protease CtpA/Prc